MNPKKKENLFFSIFCVALLAALFFFVKHAEKNAPKSAPLPNESKYELNVLAKKYGIPLGVAKNINKSAIRIKSEKGQTDWKASIEKISKETSIPENIIASFLADQEMLWIKTGDYADDSGD